MKIFDKEGNEILQEHVIADWITEKSKQNLINDVHRVYVQLDEVFSFEIGADPKKCMALTLYYGEPAELSCVEEVYFGSLDKIEGQEK